MSITIANTQPEHIPQLVVHQQVCFPTLDADSWMRAEHFAAHLRIFPEGQFVALDGERVVGQCSALRVGDEAFAQHRFLDITGQLFFSTHNPQGAWLYAADMSVHPEYRRRKISKQLYDARKDLVRRLGMRGIVGGGMLSGYHSYRNTLSIEVYIARVVAGEIVDPTLTTQLRSDFVVRGIIWDYLDDAEHGSEASLIVWENR